MSTNNPWQLYTSVPGWQGASGQLEDHMRDALVALDRMVASGTPVSLAINAQFTVMSRHMDGEGLSQYGASDSEGRDELARRLQAHARALYGVRYYVDRWGGVSER